MKHACIALLIVLLPAASALAQNSRQTARLDMRRVYQVVGQLYGLDPDLLAAIARVESGNDPQAVSPKGAQGLMQLMPATAQRFSVSDPFDPIDNVLGAARFLAALRTEGDVAAPFAVNLPDLLAAYNAGPAAVSKYQGVPPFPETREYVRRVLWAYLLGALPPPTLGGTASEQGSTPSLIHPGADHHRTAHHRKGDALVLGQLAEIQRERALAMRSQQSSQPR
jgi:hypothetical protein